MKFLGRWIVNSLLIAAIVVAAPVVMGVVIYGLIGWLVMLFLASSDLPGHYSLIAFALWVLCAGARVTFIKGQSS